MTVKKKAKQTLKSKYDFKKSCNIQRLSNNLRKLLLDYVAQNKDYLPIDFDIQLYDYNLLFDFLASLSEKK